MLMPSVIILNVICVVSPFLSVMLSVVMLNVLVPNKMETLINKMKRKQNFRMMGQEKQLIYSKISLWE